MLNRRARQLQNARFLEELERVGNVPMAAAASGLTRSAITARRRRDPALAVRWDAALAAASARLAGDVGRAVGADPAVDRPGRARADPRASNLRTAGGEALVVRGRDGRCRVRRARPGRLTLAAEQAFLAALSATANVALSAAAAGATTASLYQRRGRDPGFAREWRLALKAGYEALELALLEGFAPDGHVHDAWRHNDPPPIAPMSVNQALQLLHLHQKEARLLAEPAHLKRRRGESKDAWSYRLSVMHELGQARRREAFLVAEAERRSRAGASGAETAESRPAALPDLAQITGWSRADPTKRHDPDLALFGGWRLADWEKREEEARTRAEVDTVLMRVLVGRGRGRRS